MVGRLRRWEIWVLPRNAQAFVIGVDLLLVLAIAVGFARTSVRASDLLTAGVLCGCGLLSIEGSLRLVWRRPRGASTANDMLAVWTLPAALVLPPLYAALVVVPLHAFLHIRVIRRPLVKMAFNMASIGLAGFVASTLHSLVIVHAKTWDVQTLVGSAGAIAATLACALVRQSVNSFLVAAAVSLTNPSVRLRDHFSDRESWSTVAAETCTGILVAIACVASTFAILLAIAPVLVLQRTLLLAEFREAARTDPKTGLANSSYWREVAEREIARARGGNENVAVLLVDVDHFKSVNDHFGHLTGDEVLRAVATGLTHGLRPHDLVGRFGGEEFVVLLCGSDLDQARHAAERIRAHVATLGIDVLNRREPVQVTVSIGVAAFRESGHSVHELLDAADAALYAAKHAGRNCVRVAEGTWQQVLDLTDDQPRVIDLRSQPARVD